MAIANSLIATTDTVLLTVPASTKYAITALMVCNYSATADQANETTFTMHVVKNGESKGNANMVLNTVAVPAQEIFSLSLEKLIIETGDRLIFTAAANSRLAVTLSYVEL